jgi:hypothetical protein
MQRRDEVKENRKTEAATGTGATRLEIVMGMSVCVLPFLCEDGPDVTTSQRNARWKTLKKTKCKELLGRALGIESYRLVEEAWWSLGSEKCDAEVHRRWRLSCNNLLPVSVPLRHEVWLLNRGDAITTLALDKRTIPGVDTQAVVVLIDLVGAMGRNVWGV